MSNQVMTIREMCDAFAVTPRTLRFYEAKDLLSPVRQGQRRLYSRRDRARLKLVLRGKRFGFSLDDIRQLLDMYDLDDQHQAQLHRTIELARERLDQMHRQRDDLDAAITELSDQISGGEQMLARLRGPSAA